jgi:hypothetical protein
LDWSKTMHIFGIVLLAQLAAPARATLPVLAFPEPGIDDSASYRGYQTRFLRDAAGNTVQVYLDRRDGRVVNLWADAEDESIAFTARDTSGNAVALRWASAGASIARNARARTLQYDLVADAPRVAIGWFLLGSMRVERDFQYANHHLAPFAGPPFTLPELDRLVAAVDRLPRAEQTRELKLLGAPEMRTLRARLRSTLVISRTTSSWTARVTQPSLDGRDTISLELRADPRRVIAVRVGDSISLRARDGATVPFTVRIATTGKPLTPLTRDQIFNADFLHFLASATSGARSAPDLLRARRLERQVRGVELLSSREKLMAGLPTYATYFGRDMMMSVMMMRPIWRDEMSEFAIASVLRKLGPNGDVSHEEALGGQAVREGAAEYAGLVDRSLAAAKSGERATADSLLGRARAVLRDLRVTRENYHMIDDEFQLAVLAARWLGDSSVTTAHKRAFLLDRSDYGEPRIARLIRELALVSRMTAAYAASPVAANLVSFPARDSTSWSSASWRDSGAGYAGGRYAMDINAIWAPQALAAIAGILDELRTLGFSPDSLAATMPGLAAAAPLGSYARDRARLAAAIGTWRGASRHFVVRLAPAEIQARVTARLAAMPAAERDYWTRLVATTKADQDSLAFLALALDGAGRPIEVANTDPATRLFLGDVAGQPGQSAAASDSAVESSRAAVLRDVRLFVRPYPVGLLIDEVGPVVANDAYASPSVWEAFVRDPYHGPRVVWGREINLFLLGAARRLGEGGGASAGAYGSELRAAIDSVRAAVQASGFHSELWSYDVVGGKVVPARYGTSADVQLWSTTDLAVEFALSRLAR